MYGTSRSEGGDKAMGMVPWDPFSDLARIREQMDRFAASMLGEWPGYWGYGPWRRAGRGMRHLMMPGMGKVTRPPWAGWTFGPSVDVKETDKDIVVSAEIPGVDPDNIDVEVTEDSVILKGEVKQEESTENESYRMMERRYGAFHRVIPLPAEVKANEARAEYRNGVLEIRIPRSENAKARSVKLKINKHIQ